MAILKCKMCGGDIELSADKTFGTCEYCGCSMTFPKVEDDQKAAMYNRGNYFRRIGEFDKALAVYERIVSQDEKDAEAHWCCALSRFGIEYVEDPSTYEWMPTCHRVSFDSFLEDVDYLAALENSDGITRRQYQRDAMKIAEVQRGILATSQNAEPFDVFICYKESDSSGQRTRDSLLAQDIYYQLTEQGRRVFFSRITLEDVAGAQYEPYIFAALNSAKVMIVVGTKPEYLNAVWVKNEWSRFIAMMKKDRTKLLLPCYRDMDPYDMPEQLSILQSYDMSKIGFIQDLIRGISKVLDADKPKQTSSETVVISQASNNAQALLKRGMMALEDEEWEKADHFFEEVLNQDAECAGAYLGKELASSKCRTLKDYGEKRIQMNSNPEVEEEILKVDSEKIEQVVLNYSVPKYLSSSIIKKRLDNVQASLKSYTKGWERNIKQEELYWENHKLLSKAVKFADEKLTEEINQVKNDIFKAFNEKMNVSMQENSRESAENRLQQYFDEAVEEIKKLHEEATSKLETDYQEALTLYENANTSQKLTQALIYFHEFSTYKDASHYIDVINGKIETINDQKKQEDYLRCISVIQQNHSYDEVLSAIKELAKMNYSDSAQVAEKAKEKLMAERKAEKEKNLKVNAEGIEIQKKIKELNLEYAKLGFFAGKRKKEIEAEINQLNARLNQLRDQQKVTSDVQINETNFGLLTKNDHIYFGNYLQDTKEKTPVEWMILRQDNTGVLMMSKRCLEIRRYHRGGRNQYGVRQLNVYWTLSEIKNWLNTDFMNKCFHQNERNVMKEINGSKVTLLSLEELNQYLPDPSSRIASDTQYAVDHIQEACYPSVSKFDDKKKQGLCYWMLRNDDNVQKIPCVTDNGAIDYSYWNFEYGVRPVIYISFE